MIFLNGEQRSIASDIVAVTSSAGGLCALTVLLEMLPHDFPAALLVVQHLHPLHRSQLADILNRRSALCVKEAKSGEPILTGVAYVAVPDQHLLVCAAHTILFSDSLPIHYLRPAADILFWSVAEVYQKRAIAVVLTGTGTDGSKGVQVIKRRGGRVIVQNPLTSEYDGMPLAAVGTECADYIVDLPEIAPLLFTLITSRDKHT